MNIDGASHHLHATVRMEQERLNVEKRNGVGGQRVQQACRTRKIVQG